MRTCNVCKQEQPDEMFYADNKSGWSKLCKECRKRRQWRVDKRRIRIKMAMLAKADIEITKRKLNLETQKIRQLISDYKKFTLPNRNRLKELEKRAAKSLFVNERTKRAIAGRKLNQQRAEEILQYQITVATAGIPTQHISDLWRARYGTDNNELTPETESISIDSSLIGDSYDPPTT